MHNFLIEKELLCVWFMLHAGRAQSVWLSFFSNMNSCANWITFNHLDDDDDDDDDMNSICRWMNAHKLQTKTQFLSLFSTTNQRKYRTTAPEKVMRYSMNIALRLWGENRIKKDPRNLNDALAASLVRFVFHGIVCRSAASAVYSVRQRRRRNL